MTEEWGDLWEWWSRDAKRADTSEYVSGTEWAGLLLIPLGEDCPGVGVEDVMRATAFEPGVVEFVVYMPAIGFEYQVDSIRGQVTVDR